MTTDKTIAFVGAGNMASAIIGGLIKGGYEADAIIASAPNLDNLESLAEQYGIDTSTDNASSVAQADVVVLAVKPQIMQRVCVELASALPPSALVVTVAAGISVSAYQRWLNPRQPVVRAMPNTPTMVGCGATGLFASATVTQAQKLLTETIFASTGFTAWLKNEEQLHAVTAASGSAPAYFFYLYEAMIDTAIKQGLPEPLARELVIQAGFGAAQLAKQSKDHPAQLRARVTSPKGTTEQAILSFTNDGLPAMVNRAMQACHERSEAMSKELESE